MIFKSQIFFKNYTMKQIILIFSITLSMCISSLSAQNYLSHTGNKLYNGCNQEVRLTGVNWFGFETSNKAPYGLLSRDYRSMLKQIKALGFNCIRIPWTNAILNSGAMPSSISFSGTDPYDGKNPMNGNLQGKTSIQVMDSILAYCKKIGLKIILDNHSSIPDNHANENLWYTSTFTEQQWISDWVFMANRYKNNDAVTAVDLRNEPKKNATWGNSSASTDWNKAAERCGNAILAANPGLLIMVEGIETSNSFSYWWGGNLRGVAANPVVLNKPEKLVYSAHEYGPEVYNQAWFTAGSFSGNMNGIWDDTFGYIQKNNLGHIYVGEFGIKDTNSNNGTAKTWFDTFIKYLGTKYSWTFWCMNPNSGDTGGILKDDWVSVNQWKVDRLKPYMAPMIGCVMGITEQKKEMRMSIYPNPNNGRFTIQSGVSGNLKISLMNTLGQIVYEKQLQVTEGEEYLINTEFLPIGMYAAHFKFENEVQIQKFIKNNY